MYVATLPLITVQETVSLTRHAESHKGFCLVPHCPICGKHIGKEMNYTKAREMAQAIWQHTDYCLEGALTTWILN